jgi:hypothetical protein
MAMLSDPFDALLEFQDRGPWSSSENTGRLISRSTLSRRSKRGDDMQSDLHIWLESQQVCHPQNA